MSECPDAYELQQETRRMRRYERDLSAHPDCRDPYHPGCVVCDSDYFDSEVLRCEDCGKADESVRYDTCPYASEIYDKNIPIEICPDCYRERLADI